MPGGIQFGARGLCDRGEHSPGAQDRLGARSERAAETGFAHSTSPLGLASCAMGSGVFQGPAFARDGSPGTLTVIRQPPQPPRSPRHPTSGTAA